MATSRGRKCSAARGGGPARPLDPCGRFLFATIVAAVIVAPLIYARFYYSPLFVLKIKLYFVQAVGLLCLCASLWFRGKLRLPRSPVNYPLICFIAVALLSAVVSTDMPLSLRSLIGLLSFAVVYCVASTEIRGEREVRVLIFAIAGVAALVSLYSLLQIVGVDPLDLRVKRSGSAATFMNTNFLGAYLSAALAIAVTGLPSAKSARGKYLLLGMAALIGAGLVCSRARGAWVGFMAAMALYFCLGWAMRFSGERARSIRVPALVTVLAVIAIAAAVNVVTPISFVARFASIADVGSKSVEHRFLMWETSLDMVRSRPVLGFGVGTFERQYPAYQAPHLAGTTFYGLSKGAHNDYLETASDCGLVGLASLLGLIGTALICGVRRVRNDTRAAPVVLIGLSCVTALAVLALFHNALFTPTTGLFFWLSLGLINYAPGAERDERPAAAMAVRRLVSGVLLLLVGYCILTAFLSAYYFARGSTYLFLKENREALFYFERSLAFDRRRALAHANLAVINKRLGRHDEAREEFDEAIGIEPSNAKLHHGLGSLLEDMGLVDDAVSRYELALSLNPNSVESCNRLALIHSRRGEHERAIGYYTRALEVDPDDDNLVNGLGVAYARAGRYDEAVAMLQKAVLLEPAEASYRQNLAKALGDAGMHGRAIGEYRKAHEMKPGDTGIIISMGTEYARAGDLDRALRLYRSALATEPRNAKARRCAAIVSFQAGYYDESRREWSGLLKLEADNKAALNALEKLEKMGYR